MLLLSDPTVAAVPALDCGEPLLDVRQHSELLLDHRKQDPDGAWAQLRSGVLQRLLHAQADLPPGLQLLVVEGHRPAALQRRYYEQHREELHRVHPDWPDLTLDSETSKHISPPAVAPHPCGAAVDLTLWSDGQELDLGTPVNATPAASRGGCFTDADGISADARHWRRVLGGALSSAGLVNYPPEWWHWSYGDRYWAVTTGAGSALYTPQ